MMRRSLPCSVVSCAFLLAASAAGAQTVASACALRAADTAATRNVADTTAEIGFRDSDGIIVKSFGDLRVCALGDGYTGPARDLPHDWAKSSTGVVLETRRPGDARRMEIAGANTTWSINGQTRPVDAQAGKWRTDLFAVLDPLWDAGQLRGQVNVRRAGIASIKAERARLDGEIATAQGIMNSVRAEIADVRSRERSMREQLTNYENRSRAIQSQLSAEERALSSLNGSRSDTRNVDALIRQHESTIKQLESESRRIDDVTRPIEQHLRELDADRKVSALNDQLDAVSSTIELRKARIEALDVDHRVADLESEIAALDADNRLRTLDAQVDAAVARLRDTLGR